MPILAARGVVWLAMREWQISYKKTIAEIRDLPIPKRLKAVKEIFNIGKRMLKTMLNEPKDQNEMLVDIAYEKAFKLFIDYLSRTYREP